LFFSNFLEILYFYGPGNFSFFLSCGCSLGTFDFNKIPVFFLFGLMCTATGSYLPGPKFGL
jgi:hypothetical protein